MAGNVQFAGGQKTNKKWVYYAGSDIIQPGYALCYDTAATKNASDPKTALGNQCVKPATAHLNAFAGVVAPGRKDIQGPCMVEILTPKPGEYVEALTKANMTLATTVLGPADASYALAAKTDATFNLAAVAKAAETHDSSTTEAKKLVQWI